MAGAMFDFGLLDELEDGLDTGLATETTEAAGVEADSALVPVLDVPETVTFTKFPEDMIYEADEVETGTVCVTDNMTHEARNFVAKAGGWELFFDDGHPHKPGAFITVSDEENAEPEIHCLSDAFVREVYAGSDGDVYVGKLGGDEATLSFRPNIYN